MPRRPSRRPVTARATAAARAVRGRPTRIVWLGLVTSLTLLAVLATVPARLTQDWPPPAQHAAAHLQGLAAPWVARLRVLLRDLWHVPAPVPTAETPPTTAPARRPRATPTPAPVPEPAPPAATLPHVAASFSAAKRLLYDRVDAGHWTDFYCGCTFDAAHHPDDLDACGLATLAGTKRAQRIEIDHVFPAAQFGQTRPCWRDPVAFPACAPSGARPLTGRQCCEQVDPLFATASRDLVNLVPAVGTLNGRRSDFNWGLIDRGTGEQFGTCALRIDPRIRRVEPPPAVRGNVARIMFYMRDTYGFRLSRQDQQLYAAWNHQDPPDAWERERNRRIAQIQGRGNPYVEDDRRQ
jgi:deoxyribonuclease I